MMFIPTWAQGALAGSLAPVPGGISTADPVLANTGIPMIFLTLPAMLIALIPVAITEAAVMAKHLPLDIGQTLKASFIANEVSTIIGMPVTWIVLVFLEGFTGGGRSGAYDPYSATGRLLSVTWEAPWMMPYGGQAHWMVPAATLSLMVPFFFSSWLIEYYIVKRTLRQEEGKGIGAAVRNANLVSYGLLAVIAACVLMSELSHAHFLHR